MADAILPGSGAMSKRSGRRFGTYKQRTILSQPSVARLGYSSMDHRQNGGWNLTMCAVHVIPASGHTQRFMDKKLDKNIIPMVSM